MTIALAGVAEVQELLCHPLSVWNRNRWTMQSQNLRLTERQELGTLNRCREKPKIRVLAVLMRNTQITALLICAALPLYAQLSSMSTDFAGGRLFFTTELSQAGSGQPAHGKVFVAEAGSVKPLLIYDRLEFRAPPNAALFPNGLLTNYYWVDGADLASNGSYASVSALRVCAGYTSGLCGSPNQSTIYDDRGQVAFTVDGQALLSPNGKWALSVAEYLAGAYNSLTLLNLASGEQLTTRLPVTERVAGWRGQGVADEGTAVIALRSDGLLLLRAPDFSLQLPHQAESAAIDAAGTVVVWQSGQGALYATRLSDPSQRLFLASALPGARPTLSDDGSRVLYLSSDPAPQAHVISIGQEDFGPITSEPEGIADAVLSGNGQVVWALTRTGRLLQFDLPSGRCVQYTEPLAAFLAPPHLPDSPARPAVESAPGDVLSLPASVMPEERVEITMNGRSIPVLRVERREVVVQVPWSAPVDEGEVVFGIRKPGYPSWSGNTMPVNVRASHPVLLSAVHQDFSGMISADRPARPGEIIHLYGTGFGVVTPPVPDGVPAPSTPLSRTVAVCRLRGQRRRWQSRSAGGSFCRPRPGLHRHLSDRSPIASRGAGRQHGYRCLRRQPRDKRHFDSNIDSRRQLSDPPPP